MEDCDKFQVGDRVWSEQHGFSTITGIGYTDGSPSSLEIDRFSRYNGNPIGLRPGEPIPYLYKTTPFFHAVADTDAAMRTAIARGEGLKRPAPRGRWPIQPGDRVMLVRSGGIICVNRAKDRGFACGNYLEVAGAAITNMGIFLNTGYPIAMVLRDKEEPFESALENMRWMMDEAIKEGWYEKCGKK